jgi:hypothetical protein
MKEDVPLNSLNVGFFCPIGIVFKSNGFMYPQQFFLGGSSGVIVKTYKLLLQIILAPLNFSLG